MRSKLIACALLISVSSTALADPKDYKFQAVSATVKKGEAVVAVRLTSRGKPVSGAEIVKSEINMADVNGHSRSEHSTHSRRT
jgi:hypothetical protein